jgi:hypothetical protein
MKLTQTKSKRGVSRKAFAMIEIVVSSAVFGILFVSLYAGISSGFGFVQLARENLRGTQILQEKMETIRLYTWDQVNTTGFIPATFNDNFFASSNNNGGLIYTGRVTIASAPISEAYSNDLKQVTIQVEWKSGRVLRTREMTTYIARYGLQTYIY